MTQAIMLEQTLLDKFKSLTPQQQQEVINFIEFLQFKANQSEITEEEEQEKAISFLEAAKEFIGCVEGGPGDLATNKEYLKGIGHK